MVKTIFLLLVFTTLMVVSCCYGFTTTSYIDPNLSKLFQNHPGSAKSWLGADGTFSVELTQDNYLFMWQDTWLGTSSGVIRHPNGFTRNTAATVHVVNSQPTSPMSYYWRDPWKGYPNGALLTPVQPDLWFWPAGAVVAGTNLSVISSLNHLTAQNNWAVQWASTFSCVTNALTAPPTQWKIASTTNVTNYGNNVTWNAAIGQQGDYTYLMGVLHTSKVLWDQYAVMSRYKNSDIAKCDYSHQECWIYTDYPANKQKGWSSDCSRSKLVIIFNQPSETSIRYNADLNKWVTWRVPYLSYEVWVLTSQEITGPYTEQKVFELPQDMAKWAQLCYCPKEHAQFANKNEFVVTMNCNSNLTVIENTPWMYVPIPIRVTIHN